MIADLNLGGGQSGTELSVRLNTTRPKLKYLFISGYPVEGWSERDKENVARLPAMVYSVLAKPFSAGVLVNAIKNLTARGKKIGPNTDAILRSPKNRSFWIAHRATEDDVVEMREAAVVNSRMLRIVKVAGRLFERAEAIHC